MRATNKPVMKCEARSFWLVVASSCTPNTLAYESSCASTDPTSSHAERARQLGVRRVRAGRA